MEGRAAAQGATLRPMLAGDWPAVREIYRQGIATRNATFETEPPSWEDWDAGHRDDLRLVAVDGEVVGFVAASDTSSRCCYAGVIEHSLYVRTDRQGRGIGRLLLSSFVAAAEEVGIWTIESGVFPENTASIGLHRSCGFRVVGRRHRLGQLDGMWRDVITLEWRSRRPELGGAESVDLVEVSCTLAAADRRERAGEWSGVVQNVVTRLERTSPESLRLDLPLDRESIGAVVDLARREKGCCEFFDFRLDISSDAVALLIEVPSGAGGVLDMFASLAPAITHD